MEMQAQVVRMEMQAQGPLPVQLFGMEMQAQVLRMEMQAQGPLPVQQFRMEMHAQGPLVRMEMQAQGPLPVQTRIRPQLPVPPQQRPLTRIRQLPV